MTIDTKDPLHGFEHHAKRPIIPIEVGTVVAYTLEFLRGTGQLHTLRSCGAGSKRGQVQSIDETGLIWVSWAGETEARPCKAYALEGCKGPSDSPCGTRSTGSDPYESLMPGGDDRVWRPEPVKVAKDKVPTREVGTRVENAAGTHGTIVSVKSGLEYVELDDGCAAIGNWDIPVPKFTASSKERESFDDDVLDRLFALNELRAADEAQAKKKT